MRTTVEFLDAVKSRYSLASDYALAKFLGAQQSRISNYRNGRSHLDDEIAIRVAQLLEIEPGYVLACVHLERAKSEPEQAAWTSIMQRLAACLVLTVTGLAGVPSPAEAAPVGDSAGNGNLYYVKRRKQSKRHKVSTFSLIGQLSSL